MRFDKAVTMALAVILAVLATVPLAPPAWAQRFDPATFTLDNGLEVVVITDTRAPVVSHMVWYRVGGADEPPGVSGIAHFLEHLMFKGTETRGPGEASRIVNRIGGQENAFTSSDYTGYYQNVAADQLATVMELEADRMANLKLDEVSVASEREVILEERSSRIDNNPSARFREQIEAAMFLAYPYRIPLIGWRHEMERLSLHDARAWYETWYAPNNAILVLAGDITPERARALAERFYGPVPRRDVPARTRVDEPPQEAPRRLEYAHPQVGAPNFSRRYLAPSQLYGATEHALPLEVLAAILGGGTTSRLYEALVVADKVAVSAGAWYGSQSLGPTAFGFYGVPAEGRTLADVEAAIDAEIARLLTDGVTAAEVDEAIAKLRAEAVFARDDVLAPARIFGSALAIGLTVEDVETWPDRIARVTPEQVLAAARHVLKLEQSVTGLLRPAAPS